MIRQSGVCDWPGGPNSSEECGIVETGYGTKEQNGNEIFTAGIHSDNMSIKFPWNDSKVDDDGFCKLDDA